MKVFKEQLLETDKIRNRHRPDNLDDDEDEYSSDDDEDGFKLY